MDKLDNIYRLLALIDVKKDISISVNILPSSVFFTPQQFFCVFSGSISMDNQLYFFDTYEECVKSLENLVKMVHKSDTKQEYL